MGKQRVYLGGWIRLGCISKRFWVVGGEKRHPATYIVSRNKEYLWVAIGLDESIEYGLAKTWLVARGAANQFLRDSPPSEGLKPEG
tara:strand:- start:1229 stop:1486 length:258 start_codon:yes stop_codon:yes gene_type:complete